MNNHETMSREEIMRAIEGGDRYAGVIVETIDDKVDAVLEDNDRLDKKIDGVDAKLEEFRRETNQNFNIVFEEMRAMQRESEALRKEFSERFDRLEKIR